jgi:FkbH-like protein
MNENIIYDILGHTVQRDPGDIKNLPTSMHLIDIGLNSLNFIRFIVELEKALNIEILDSDLVLENFKTIDTLMKMLNKYFSHNYCNIKKVIISDCDNVLWHGIAGEEMIHIDTNTQKLQTELIDLYNRGILICLCSKNKYANIVEAFNTLDMPLNFSHVISYKINMLDKVSNIKQISEELNLDMASFVFIDDSNYELGCVKGMLPEIATIKVDYKNLNFIEQIKEYFSSASSADKNRTKQYREQKEREKNKSRYETIDDYNKSLDTSVVCDYAREDQCNRIAELSQRTNQFNLSGKRYCAETIHNLLSNNEYNIFTLSASDKYGDMGIIGAAIIKVSENIVIENFFLSCRVFGRDLEEILIDKIKATYENRTIVGIYNYTEKNKHFSTFYSEHGVCEYE